MQKVGLFALFALFAIFAGCTTINELASEVASCKVSNGYDVSCIRNLALQKNDPNVCTRVFGEGSREEMVCIMDYAQAKNDKAACDILSKEISELCKNRIS